MVFFRKKEKFKFNPNTLQYEKEKFNYKVFFIKLFGHSFVLIIGGVLFVILYSLLYPYYLDNAIKRENEFLKTQFISMNEELKLYDFQLDTLAKNDNNIYRTMLIKDSIPFAIRNSGMEAKNAYKKLEGYSNSELIQETRKKLDKIGKKISVQSKSQEEILAELAKNEKYYKSAPILQPLHVNQMTRFSSNFGYRPHPILGIMQFHRGIDLTAPLGTPVYAAGNGIVSFCGFKQDGYGNDVVIDHKVRGLSSRYAHLSKIDVVQGQNVKRGQKIGEVGNSGLSTAPHLHFEIMKNGEAINPIRYMFAPSADNYELLIKEAKYKTVTFD
ncbi:MAG: M23 family metallopeptidase [Bacteroidales bacterium]|jgi:murein DD-endopeptidase MepM/ murein hydrolase activator NlpD|nr:M23 family metallopeptidase [Bacteroidales bacterium]